MKSVYQLWVCAAGSFVAVTLIEVILDSVMPGMLEADFVPCWAAASLATFVVVKVR